MSLSLSAADIDHFRALQETLLSPLTYPSVPGWCRAVIRQAETLFQADRSAIFVPIWGHVHYVSETIDPKCLDAFQQGITSMQPGAVHFTEESVDRAWAARRASNLEVWSIPLLERLSGISMEDIDMYHEAVKPAGLVHSAVATTAMPAGEAFLGISHSRPAKDPFGDARLQLMRMLVPAFKAGLCALLNLDQRRTAVLNTLDETGPAVALHDCSGHEMHRSPRLVALLADEPERCKVEIAIQAIAGGIGKLLLATPGAGPVRTTRQEIATRYSRYALNGTVLDAGVMARDAVVLILISLLTPQLPKPSDLIQRYHLTAREAEVAIGLARGLTNREMAAQLGLSRHTIRHHVEWVFAKINVRTRKALGLCLLGDHAPQ